MHLIVSAGVLRSVLPVLDRLDMALQQDRTRSVRTRSSPGCRSSATSWTRCSAKGVDRIEPVPGDEFDPTRHEAMLKQEADGVESGRITSLLQVGYQKSDQVLRAAKVAVAPEPPCPPTTTDVRRAITSSSSSSR